MIWIHQLSVSLNISIAPWTSHIAVDFSLHSYPKDSSLDYVFQISLCRLPPTDFVSIFKDGSKSNSYVGSAFVCDDKVLFEQISPLAFTFTAQTYAVHLTLKHIRIKGHRHSMIYSNSLSTLQTLILWKCSSHPLVSTVHRLLSSFSFWDIQSSSVKFWNVLELKGMSAIPNNSHPLSVPFMDSKSVIKQKLLLSWQNMWAKQINNKLHKIKPLIE